MGLLIFLFLLATALVAWGIQSVPAGMQWLPKLFGRRLPYRLTEGLVWLPRWPRWFFDKEVCDIREEEFHILGDQLPDGSKRETIMTTNGVEVVVRGVVGYYTIARQDPDGKRSWLRFLGWQSGTLLLAYSQVRNQDVINRVPPTIRSSLRTLIQTFSFQEILGLSIEGMDMPAADRESIRTSRNVLQDELTTIARKQAEVWGLYVTRIIVGDIDPNDELKKVLQLKAKALLEKTAAIIQTSALVEQAMVIHKRTSDVENPTHAQLMATIRELYQLKNQQIAAENGGNIGRVVQNLVDLTGRVAATA